MHDILQPILHSPRLKEYVNKLSSLNNEEARRQYYYDVITEEQKAEFINGEVVFHLPDTKKENKTGSNLLVLLNTFVSVNDLGFVGYGRLLIHLSRNDFEPDVCFFRKEVADTFSDKTMFFPAPDFIAEVLSKSTQKNDRGVKFEDYAFHEVKEYWIIDPDNETVEQYILDDEKKYQLFVKLNEGMIYCKAVSGFNIPVKALFDEKINNDTLKQLI